MKAIDTISDITPQTALALKQKGVGAVFGYLGPWSKCFTPERLKALKDAGMSVGFFYEGGGRIFNSSVGIYDAKQAVHFASILGVPKGVGIGICPAVDYDAQPSDYAAITAYLQSWRKVLGSDYRLGLYASIHVLEALKSEYDYAIEPSAWSEGQKLNGAAMYQNSVSTTLCGIGVDIDEVDDTSILWGGNTVAVTYPTIQAEVDGKSYLAIAVGDFVYLIWTVARDTKANLTKVKPGDVEIDGKKPLQVQYDGNDYIEWSGIPTLAPHPVKDANGVWQFKTLSESAPTQSTPAPKPTPTASTVNDTRDILATWTGYVQNDGFFFNLPIDTEKSKSVGPLQMDTGAWETVISGGIASYLGLPNLGTSSMTGVDGKPVPTYTSEIPVVVGGQTYKMACTVDPAWSMTASVGLFGLRGFIDNGLALDLNPAKATLTIYKAD